MNLKGEQWNKPVEKTSQANRKLLMVVRDFVTLCGTK